LTCTHAALVRRDLLKVGFHYDNVIIEEAAQILEIEAFVPLLLQQCAGDESRLKRVVLIGDDKQLPPVRWERGPLRGSRNAWSSAFHAQKT
jgi:intron-binding protein aquarius